MLMCQLRTQPGANNDSWLEVYPSNMPVVPAVKTRRSLDKKANSNICLEYTHNRYSVFVRYCLMEVSPIVK